MIAPTVTADAAAYARAELRRLRDARDDAERRMIFAVALGDDANADHWDHRMRHAERRLAAAYRAIRAARPVEVAP